jgi:K+-sensing histidine kinase KdpD
MAWISLKTQNLPTLALIMIGQVSIAYALSNPDFDWSSIEVLSPDTVVVSLIVLIAALFSSLLPASVKHQLVFLRRKNALPGHRFLQLAEHDQRIDLLRLKQQVQPLVQLNVTEEQQNRVWYLHIYHPHQNAPLVKSAHKAFLQWRDSMVVSIFIALLLAVGVQTLPAVAVAFSPFSFLVSVFFVVATGCAAHHNGKRMVTNAVVVWLLKPGACQQ